MTLDFVGYTGCTLDSQGQLKYRGHVQSTQDVQGHSEYGNLNQNIQG